MKTTTKIDALNKLLKIEEAKKATEKPSQKAQIPSKMRPFSPTKKK